MLSAWFSPVSAQQYRVAACDWMMLKRQKLGEFQLAKDIHADGIEMDMGPQGKRELFENKLREEHFQQLFRRTADSLGIAVPSMAMSGFISFAIFTASAERATVPPLPEPLVENESIATLGSIPKVRAHFSISTATSASF